jgi:sterol desaturase/sphingolipid hydroxylase (fatty acid hydroxylase superfamily)
VIVRYVVQIAATCWLGVAAHDLWFYLLHTTLHSIKWLYAR